MKKWLAVLLCVTMLAALCGCSKQAEDTTPTENMTIETTEAISVPVGLCLPNQTEAQWIAEGAALKSALEAKGCQVMLEDANGDVLLQAQQIETLIEEKVACLVVAAVDSAALTQSIALAKKAGIPVIAYDRLLINADGVTGYVSFDYWSLGLEMAQKIAEAKALETAEAEKRSYTVEVLMDTYENHANVLYYQGLMQGLKGYLDAGVLVCKSGRVLFEDVCVKNADAAKAQSLCDTLLSDNYEEAWPEILITGNDVLAEGCIAALKAKKCPAESWPLIAGQNAAAEGVARVVAGEQMFTAYYDRTGLVQDGANAVEAVLAGNTVGTQSSDNGAVTVPAALRMPAMITLDNYKELLLDTGFFAPEEVGHKDTAQEEAVPEETA